MASTKNAISSRGKPYSYVSGSLHADDARRVSGFRFRLYSDDWNELGEFETIVPNWSTGDEFTIGDGRRFRIVGPSHVSMTRLGGWGSSSLADSLGRCTALTCQTSARRYGSAFIRASGGSRAAEL